MKEMNKEYLLIIFSAEAVALAEQVKWQGETYTHPEHGACAATFFQPSAYAQTEIVCFTSPIVNHQLTTAFLCLVSTNRINQF